MLLGTQDFVTFFKLHRTFMFFVNQRLKVLSEKVATPEDFPGLPPQLRVRVRDAWLANVGLVDDFASEYSGRFSEEELEIVRSWRLAVSGKFYVYRELARYTVLISTSSPSISYGVVAISQPFSEILLGRPLPALIETVLLPFRDKIVYDGVVSTFNIAFGAGVRRSLAETYKNSKAVHGIVTSLPVSDAPRVVKLPVRKGKSASATGKDQSKKRSEEVIRLVDDFCREHLNEEYAEICHRMAEKLSRKRPSPLLQGRPGGWASGIVRVVGGINFLHDKTQTPHMLAAEIDQQLGVSPATGSAKAAAIRKALKLSPFDSEWMLSKIADRNPLLWFFNAR